MYIVIGEISQISIKLVYQKLRIKELSMTEFEKQHLALYECKKINETLHKNGEISDDHYRILQLDLDHKIRELAPKHREFEMSKTMNDKRALRGMAKLQSRIEEETKHLNSIQEKMLLNYYAYSWHKNSFIKTHKLIIKLQINYNRLLETLTPQ